MTTALTIHQPTAELASTLPGPTSLVEWAQAASAAHELAVVLCATGFCPETFRNKPGEATAALLAGSEVGLSPLAALNAFDVISGRPAPKAVTLRALVQAQGHEVILKLSTEDRAVMAGRRRGSSEWQQVEWTIARAQRLNLTGKPNWKSQPTAMLVARATSEICRLVGADAILGIPYSSEEIEDMEPGATVTAVRTAKPTTARRALPPPTPEPSLDDEPTPAEVVEDPITKAQLTKLHAAMTERGLTDRDKGLAFLSERVGRDLTSSKELTKVEASRLIDWMSEPPEPAFDEFVDPDTGLLVPEGVGLPPEDAA